MSDTEKHEVKIPLGSEPAESQNQQCTEIYLRRKGIGVNKAGGSIGWRT